MDYPLTDNATLILSPADVCAGDVLLCYSASTVDEHQAQPLGYSHAAIVLSDQKVLDASSSGVRIGELDHLLDDYEHLAVLTTIDAWGPLQLQKLEQFALFHRSKKFNMRGMLSVPDKRQQQSNEVMERVKKFFDQPQLPTTAHRESFFCSELIVCAFIDAGLITDSASIVLSPDVLSPSDIGKDKAFGFFRGYVTRSAEYKVPEMDYFRTSL